MDKYIQEGNMLHVNETDMARTAEWWVTKSWKLRSITINIRYNTR